jgi:cobalt-precorrin-5B (C1)-methyltransferase
MFLAKDKDQDLEKLAEQEQKLPPEIEEKKRKGTLRTGYTTGTTATAAQKERSMLLSTASQLSR